MNVFGVILTLPCSFFLLTEEIEETILQGKKKVLKFCKNLLSFIKQPRKKMPLPKKKKKQYFNMFRKESPDTFQNQNNILRILWSISNHKHEHVNRSSSKTISKPNSFRVSLLWVRTEKLESSFSVKRVENCNKFTEVSEKYKEVS